LPDRRTHRGPHPEDSRLFDQSAHPILRQATADLCWLLDRGYARESSLKLVGDRYKLLARQRIAVSRCSCSRSEADRRTQHRVSAEEIRGRPLLLDGYNVLTTIEAALSGGVILACRDGTYRDMAGMHGSYRKVAETIPALNLLGRAFTAFAAAECRWLLDRPVSNSGRLKTLIEGIAERNAWNWTVELVPDPDDLLASSEEVVATADSDVLDRCRRWFNLARETIAFHQTRASLVDMSL
jgi:hypothetical protein